MTTGIPVLVTGGAGYVGSHVCLALAAAGHAPVTLDSLARGHREAVRWGPLEVGDVRDRGFVAAALRRHRVEAVVHCAALAYVGESMAEPLRYLANNVAGSLALFEACAEAGVDRLVFSSTCAVYGEPERTPIPEDHAMRPVNPYGESKLMVERALAWLDRAGAMRHAILRYFNAAGADPGGAIGEAHAPETHLVPLAIFAALGRAPALRVFGRDWPTPDGTAIRDYVHVADLADAHVAALARLGAGAPSLTVNLGTGRGASVREVVDAVARAAGRAVPTVDAPRRPGDPPALVAAPGAAAAALGWTPRRSGLDDIVGDALAWHARGPAWSRAGG